MHSAPLKPLRCVCYRWEAALDSLLGDFEAFLGRMEPAVAALCWGSSGCPQHFHVRSTCHTDHKIVAYHREALEAELHMRPMRVCTCASSHVHGTCTACARHVHRHAHEHLLTAGGSFVPARARVYVALASVRVEEVAGFDLRHPGFNGGVQLQHLQAPQPTSVQHY